MVPLSRWNKDLSGWGVDNCYRFLQKADRFRIPRQNQNRKFFTRVKVCISVLQVSSMDVDWFIDSLKR